MITGSRRHLPPLLLLGLLLAFSAMADTTLPGVDTLLRLTHQGQTASLAKTLETLITAPTRQRETAEARLLAYVRELRTLPPNHSGEAALQRLQHYESQILDPPHDPRSPSRPLRYPVAAAAQGTLTLWASRRSGKPLTDKSSTGSEFAAPIVQLTAYEGNWALGYPVPEPVDSLTPVAGFRSLASLQARHASLVESPWVSAQLLGQSIQGRQIWRYALSDADTVTQAGLPEPAVLFSGGVHAREWQAIEAVTGLYESLVASAEDQSLGQFLLENLQILLVPLVNPDGIAHTQRYFRYGVNNFSDTREGRLRRKNLRDSDGVLETLQDHLLGVDINRQFTPFWGGGSLSPESILYHGPMALSEPEAQALTNAVDDDIAGRLRLYVDFHSFGRVFIAPETDRPALDLLTRELIGRLQAHLGALGSTYRAQYWPRSAGIGATDEYHAEHYGVPAWTFELEPQSSASEYGGFGLRNDGFILPDNQIQRVRAEVDSSYRLALYHQYGPPTLHAVQIHRADTQQVVFAARWRRQGTQRRLIIQQDGPLQPGQDYLLWLSFDKPMRHRLNGEVANYPGQTVDLAPIIALQTKTQSLMLTTLPEHWRNAPGGAPLGYQRYQDDALMVPFSTPQAAWLGGVLQLQVQVSDMVGLALDADPTTPVGFAAGWQDYQGGVDGSVLINATDTLFRNDFED